MDIAFLYYIYCQLEIKLCFSSVSNFLCSFSLFLLQIKIFFPVDTIPEAPHTILYIECNMSYPLGPISPYSNLHFSAS